MLTREILQDNIRRLFDKVSEAASLANKCLEDISIVAAIKTQPIEIIKSLKESGINRVGENRVQEMISRYDRGLDLEWHFIGQLQTNKVKYIIDKVSLFHSLDRKSLGETLNKEAEKHNIKVNALIEINAGGELSKGGVDIGEVIEFAKELSDYPNISIKGLMSIMPIESDDKLEYYFKRIHDKYYELERIGIKPEILSLGMSGDYELAIRCGSNMIRPGRVLFGERSY